MKREDWLRQISDDLENAAQELRDERPATKEAWDAIKAMEHGARWLWSAAASLKRHEFVTKEPPF